MQTGVTIELLSGALWNRTGHANKKLSLSIIFYISKHEKCKRFEPLRLCLYKFLGRDILKFESRDLPRLIQSSNSSTIEGIAPLIHIVSEQWVGRELFVTLYGIISRSLSANYSCVLRNKLYFIVLKELRTVTAYRSINGQLTVGYRTLNTHISNIHLTVA